MTTVHFPKVTYMAVRKWKDATGKRHREQKTFWQTISPFNTNEAGVAKTRGEIFAELVAEANAWRMEVTDA